MAGYVIADIGKNHIAIVPSVADSLHGAVIAENVMTTLGLTMTMNGGLMNGLMMNGGIMKMNKSGLRCISLVFCPLFFEIGVSYEAVTNTINVMLPFLRLVIRLKNWPDFSVVWLFRSRMIF